MATSQVSTDITVMGDVDSSTKEMTLTEAEGGFPRPVEPSDGNVTESHNFGFDTSPGLGPVEGRGTPRSERGVFTLFSAPLPTRPGGLGDQSRIDRLGSPIGQVDSTDGTESGKLAHWTMDSEEDKVSSHRLGYISPSRE